MCVFVLEFREIHINSMTTPGAGTVGVTLPGVSLAGTFSVSLNNTAAAVAETFQLNALAPGLALADLRNGAGISTTGTPAHFSITRRSGASFSVSIAGATTLQDVIDAINTAAGGPMASLLGGSLRLVDDSTGGGTLTVAALNASPAAAHLGILGAAPAGTRAELIGALLHPRVALALPAGPYVRVSGTHVTLSVQGQSLLGNIDVEQVTQPGGRRITRLALSGVSLRLGDGTTDFVSVTDGQGTFLVTPAGVAGRLSAHVDVSAVPGATFQGSFGLAVNTTALAVVETFRVGGEELSLNLPAGPFLRVEGTGLTLTLLSQVLTGDFAFEQLTAEGGARVVRLAAAAVSLTLSAGGSAIATLSGGQGSLLIRGGAQATTVGL